MPNFPSTDGVEEECCYNRTNPRSLVTDQFFWRGGRAVDRAGLENRKAERPREFESHPLRFLGYQALISNGPYR